MEVEGTGTWRVWVKPSPIAGVLLRLWSQAQENFAAALRKEGYEVKVEESGGALSWTLKVFPETNHGWTAAGNKFESSVLDADVVGAIKNALRRFRLMRKELETKELKVGGLKRIGFEWSWTWEEGKHI